MTKLTDVFDPSTAQVAAILLAVYTDRLSLDEFFNSHSPEAVAARSYFAFMLVNHFNATQTQVAQFLECSRNTVVGYLNAYSKNPVPREVIDAAYRAKYIWKYFLAGFDKKR